jgi:hypothetical protein
MLFRPFEFIFVSVPVTLIDCFSIPKMFSQRVAEVVKLERPPRLMGDVKHACGVPPRSSQNLRA